MKRWKSLLGLLAAWTLEGCISPSGGGTEAEGLSGQLVNALGAPAAGALVRVYRYETGDLAKAGAAMETAEDSTLTDARGGYAFSSLKDGRYNVEGTVQKDGGIQSVFIPNVLLKGRLELGTDTLRAPGGILLRAHSDGEPLEGAQCYIPGSSRIAISDDSGRCLITGVPRGLFRVRLKHEGLLTVTSGDILVRSGEITDAGIYNLVADPALPPPPPKGLSVRYDSLTGVATLTWRPVRVSDLAGYVVYRRQSLAETPERISLQLVADTVFRDTLRRGSGDNTPALFLYQLKSQDQGGNLSLVCSDPVGITALPPVKQGQYFSLTPSTVALWTFNSHQNGTFADLSANGYHLSNANNLALASAPYDSAAVFTGAVGPGTFASRISTTALTIAGTGKLTYEARVLMTQYPSSSNQTQNAVIVGTYEGIRLEVRANGSLLAGGQKTRNGTGYWHTAQSSAGAVPLNRWVNLAVAFDQSTGQAYGYIDGSPVQLYATPNTDPFRVSATVFAVGNNPQDQDQPFNGQIDEIRVSNNLSLGPGLPLTPPATSAPTDLRYSPNPATYIVGTAIAPSYPTSGGGQANLSYSLFSGSLPPGLSLSTSTGAITGTPTAAGTFSPIVKVQNSGGSDTETVSITVLAAAIDTVHHFALNSSTVALWTFNSHKDGTFEDIGPNHFHLSGADNFALTISPYGSAAVFTGSAALSKSYLSHTNDIALSVSGTGKLTYEVRVYLKPGQSGGGAPGGWLIGTYDGFSLQIGADGHFRASGQKVRNGTNYWVNEASSPGVVPLNQWVNLAVAFDQSTGQAYGYVNGTPVQLYRLVAEYPVTDPFRIPGGSFFVGNDGVNQNFQFSGLIDEIRVSNNLVLGPGLPLRTDSTSQNPSDTSSYFGQNSSTVALWTFNSVSNNKINDIGPNGFHLAPTSTIPSLEASPYGSAMVFTGSGQRLQVANNSLLTIAGTGKLTLEARVFIAAYPSSSNANQVAHVAGMYEGLKLFIGSDGSLHAGGQVGNGATWVWYSPNSSAGAEPLNQWVNLAVAVDQSSSQIYAYVNGVPVQLYRPSSTTYTQIRPGVAPFTVGHSDRDNQPFPGKIEEVRVSNSLVLGSGLPLRDSGTSPSDTLTYFGKTGSTVALWTFNSTTDNQIKDIGPNGFHLSPSGVMPSLETSPYGSAMIFTNSGGYLSRPGASALAIAGEGQMTLEARIYLTQYPSASNFNQTSHIVGMYEGPYFLIYSDGSLAGGCQKLGSTGSYWHGSYTDPGVIPLNRWVNVALAFDSSGQTYGYIDGNPVQLYTTQSYPALPDTNPWRTNISTYTVGNSSVNNNRFVGKIEEIRVSDKIVLGTGFPVMWTTRSPPGQ